MIYTRKGDFGETSLACGKRVSKDCLRVECYGTVDELNSYLGLLRSCINEKIYQEELIKIQEDLFTIQSLLAAEAPDTLKKMPVLEEKRVSELEQNIDSMVQRFPLPKSFTMPGGTGSIASSNAHVARCICRKTERLIVSLSKENTINQTIECYINRLSDYLYSLANALLYVENKENIFIKF